MSESVTSSSVDLSSFFIQDASGYRPASVHEVLLGARQVLRALLRNTPVMGSSSVVQDYLAACFANLEREVFAVMFLDSKYRLIELNELFRGSVAQTSVYPREILKEAVLLNASSVVLVRNDTSGYPEPRQADEVLVKRLREALSFVDVRVLDYVIVGRAHCVSLAELCML